MALPTGLGQRALQSLNRPSALQFIGAPQVNAPATQPVPQNIMGLRQNVLAQQMRQHLTPAQQFRQLAGMSAAERLGQQPPSAPPKAPTGMQGLLSGLMPEAGTPEMAGYGAAGQKLLELSGYRAVPITIGEALGQAAGAYGEARGAALQQQKEQQAAQAALERQARLDAMAAEKQAAELANIRSQIAQREEPAVAGLPQLGATREVPVGKGMVQLQEFDGTKYVDIGVPYKKEETKKSDFVTFFKGDDYQTVREGSEDADKLARSGYRIIEGTTLTGSMQDIMGKPTKTKIEGSLLGATEAYVELKQVRDKFDPYFLTVQGKTAYNLAKAKDSIGQGNADDVKLIKAYSDWQTNSWTQVNNYIKALTGAQMSEAEAKRIMKSLPDPRTGYFEGMTPSQYEQALDSTIEAAARTIARSSYFLKNGLTPVKDESRKFKRDDEGNVISGDGKDILYIKDDQVIDTDDMDEIIRKETLSLRDKYAELPADEAKAKVASDLSVLFGLGFDDLKLIISSGA
jgi:hypothetical protein